MAKMMTMTMTTTLMMVMRKKILGSPDCADVTSPLPIAVARAICSHLPVIVIVIGIIIITIMTIILTTIIIT